MPIGSTYVLDYYLSDPNLMQCTYTDCLLRWPSVHLFVCSSQELTLVVDYTDATWYRPAVSHTMAGAKTGRVHRVRD